MTSFKILSIILLICPYSLAAQSKRELRDAIFSLESRVKALEQETANILKDNKLLRNEISNLNLSIIDNNNNSIVAKNDYKRQEEMYFRLAALNSTLRISLDSIRLILIREKQAPSTSQKKSAAELILPQDEAYWLKRPQNPKPVRAASERIYQTRYIRGPRGGCYYINSNGNKTYVDRSLCN